MELETRQNTYTGLPSEREEIHIYCNSSVQPKQENKRSKNWFSILLIFLVFFSLLQVACIIFLFIQSFDMQQQKIELIEILKNQNWTLEERIESEAMNLDLIRQKADTSCAGVTFNFPRGDQVNDYVKYLSHFPRLKDATVCAWVEKKRVSIDGQNEEFAKFITILSYFISEDELIIGITSKRKVYFRIKSTAVYINASLPSENQTFHLCVKMMSIENHVKVYVNGTQQAAVNYTYDVIPGGGSFLLAQEQDSEGFFFKEAYQAFRGSITNLMIWPRSLSDQEINNIATKCDCPQDYSVAMTMDGSELYGNAFYSVPDQCPRL